MTTRFACPVCYARTVGPLSKIAIASRVRTRCQACGCRLQLAYPVARALSSGLLAACAPTTLLLLPGHPLLPATLCLVALLGAEIVAPLKLDVSDSLSVRLANRVTGVGMLNSRNV